MLVLCIFQAGYKSYENAQKELKNPNLDADKMSQGSECSL